MKKSHRVWSFSVLQWLNLGFFVFSSKRPLAYILQYLAFQAFKLCQFHCRKAVCFHLSCHSLAVFAVLEIIAKENEWFNDRILNVKWLVSFIPFLWCSRTLSGHYKDMIPERILNIDICSGLPKKGWNYGKSSSKQNFATFKIAKITQPFRGRLSKSNF